MFTSVPQRPGREREGVVRRGGVVNKIAAFLFLAFCNPPLHSDHTQVEGTKMVDHAPRVNCENIEGVLSDQRCNAKAVSVWRRHCQPTAFLRVHGKASQDPALCWVGHRTIKTEDKNPGRGRNKSPKAPNEPLCRCLPEKLLPPTGVGSGGCRGGTWGKRVLEAGSPLQRPPCLAFLAARWLWHCATFASLLSGKWSVDSTATRSDA